MKSQTTRRPAVKAGAKTVDAYLAGAPKDQRAALVKVRKTIKATARAATEAFAYGMAGYKYKGKPLVYFGYWATHCALYGASIGTIRFTPDEPLPEKRITKIVRERMAAIEQGGPRGAQPREQASTRSRSKREAAV